MSAQAAAPTPASEGARARRLTERVFRVRELGIIVAFLALVAVTGILEPRFLEAGSCWSRATSTSRSARCSA